MKCLLNAQKLKAKCFIVDKRPNELERRTSVYFIFVKHPGEVLKKFNTGRLRFPYPFIYHFGRKGTPFVYLIISYHIIYLYLSSDFFRVALCS